MKAGLLDEGASPVTGGAQATVVAQVAAVPVAPAGGNAVPVLSGVAPMEVEGQIYHGVQMTRPARDLAWAAFFGISLLVAVALGAHTLSSVSTAGDKLKTCDAFKKSFNLDNHPTPSVQVQGDTDTAYTSQDADIADIATKFVFNLSFIFVAAVCLSAVFLYGLEQHARIITWISVCVWPVFMLLLGVFMATQKDAGLQTQGYITCAVAALMACIIYARREAVELTSEILRMSATAFKQNLGLIPTTAIPGFLVSILVLSPLTGCFYVSLGPREAALMSAGCPECIVLDDAHMSGYGADPYSDPYSDSYSSPPSPVHWSDLQKECGDDVDPGPVNQAIVTTLAVVLIWVSMLRRDINTCTIGGCIGLHYFETPFGEGSRAVQGLKWAVTSSFGSLCYSSFLMTLVTIVDAFLRRMQEEARSGNNVALKIVMAIVMCLWAYLEAYLEFLNKMAVLSLALTADPFCASAKKVQNMLLRHNLDGILVDSFGSITLFCFSMTLSVMLGYAAYGYELAAKAGDSMAVAVGIVGWFFAFLILMSISGMVLLISNTHYLCYIMDLDANQQPQPRTEHIHGLYQRAIANKIKILRQNPKKWASSGPGKREKATGTKIDYTHF